MFTVTPLNGVFGRMATLNSAMDEVLGRDDTYTQWTPATDAWETEQAFVVQLDLPGLTPDHVDVNFDRNTLTVRGTRGATIPQSEGADLRVFFAERTPGSFSRSLRFPQYVESTKIEAAFTNGVLTITVPKAETAKPRKIEIAKS